MHREQKQQRSNISQNHDTHTDLYTYSLRYRTYRSQTAEQAANKYIRWPKVKKRPVEIVI